jgi:hypothetical protein
LEELRTAKEDAANEITERAEAGTLEQPGFDLPPRGGFVPDQLLAIFTETADFSTFLHELSHWYWQVMVEFASREDAPPTILRDVDTVLEWFGIEGDNPTERIAAWNAMSFEQQREHTESFAFNSEVYFFEGKAPTNALKRVYNRFRNWIIEIYKKGIRGELNAVYRREFNKDLPVLTDEVRRVMDRMVASHEQIQISRAERALEPLFKTKEQYIAEGGTEEGYQRAQEANLAAFDQAVAELTEASLDVMQFQSRFKDRYLKEQAKKHNAARKKVKAEVEQEVAHQPVYRTFRFLRKGEMLNDDNTVTEAEGVHKLDSETVREMLPGVDLRALGGKNGILQKDGIHPDDVARDFDFESGEAMLREMLDAPTETEAVARRTDERMESEFSDLADPEMQQIALDKALHNELFLRFLAMEWKFLTKSTQPVRMLVAAAKAQAEQVLLETPVKNIRPDRYAQAAERNAKEAAQAMKAGALGTAWQAKQQQILNSQLVRESAKVRQQLAKDQKLFRQLRKSDRKVGPKRDIDAVDVARAIGARHGINTLPGKRTLAEHTETLQREAPESYQALMELVGRLNPEPVPWKEMLFGDYMIMRDAVESFWDQSLRAQQVRTGQQLVDLEEAVKQILPNITDPKRKEPRSRESRNLVKTLFRSVKSAVRHVESWALEMDGGTPGAVHTFIFNTLRQAFDSYRIEHNDVIKPLHDAANSLDLKAKRQIVAHELNDFVFQSKREVVGALLHSGNEDNLRRLLLGYNMVAQPAKTDGPIDTGAWWRFVDRMIRDKVLTREEFEFVQAVWDTFGSWWSRTQEVHKQVYGYRVRRLEPRPIVNELGTWRGGYAPAKIDRHEAARRGNPVPSFGEDVLAETAADFKATIPTTGRSHTKERTGPPRPLELDIGKVAYSMDEHLRFIHLQIPGRDTLKILNHPQIKAAIGAMDTTLMETMLRPWLRDTLKNKVIRPGGVEGLDRFLTAARRNVGIGIMFANPVVALQQVTGMANSSQFVKLLHLRAAASRYWGDHAEYVKWIVESSNFMNLRLHDHIGQITDDADVLFNPTWLGNAQAWTRRHGHFMQRWFQNPVDIITWGGAYDQAITQKKSHEDAVTFADSVVRRAQGSGLAPDISAFERSSALVRLLTQFSTYWIASLNMVMQQHGADRVRTIGVLLAFVGLGGAAISMALRGGWDDEDEDGAMWDDIAMWAFGEGVRTAATIGLPVAGPQILNTITGEFGGRISFGAASSTAERAFRSLALPLELLDPDRDLRGTDINNVATLATMWLGLPVTVPASRAAVLLDVAEERVEPTSDADFVRALLTGRTSLASRR